MANKRSSTKPHKFAADVLLNNSPIKSWGLLSQVFAMSQKNREGITIKPTKKSATASEAINALVLVRRFPLLQTRKIVIPFPRMVRNERTQPRIQNQISILNMHSYRKLLSTVEYDQQLAYISGTHVNWLLWSVFPWHHGGHIGVPKQWNGGHIGVPTNPVGVDYTLFLCKRSLLFQ